MPDDTFAEVEETFAYLDDWEDRYRYVIDLGRQMPPMDDRLKSALTKVEGCASQVWIAPRLEGGALHFQGDSDAMIVRGLIAILRLLLSGRTPGEILSEDVEGALGRLGLDQHLSAQRSNGLRAMVARLRELARGAAA